MTFRVPLNKLKKEIILGSSLCIEPVRHKHGLFRLLFYSRIDFVENMGTGIGKIKALVKKAKTPTLRFEFGDFYTIIFPRSSVEPLNAPLNGNEPLNAPLNENEPLNEPLNAPLNENEPLNEPLNAPLNENEPLNEPLNELLKEIKQNPSATRDDLIGKLGRSRATITRQIQKLKEMNLIQRIGSDKSGHWEVLDEGAGV